MSAVILPILYPFITYYAIKYATNVAVDVTIDKTKNAFWYVVTYPFKKNETKCIKCQCSKCQENVQENIQEYEIINYTNVKEKND